MKYTLKRVVFVLLFLSVYLTGIAQTIQPSSEGVVYVRKGYAGNGSSWNNAAGELADALKWANDNNGNWGSHSSLQIWVASGTYKPKYTITERDDEDNILGDRHRTFLLGPNIQLYGGFRGGEETLAQRIWANNLTVLDGDFSSNDKYDRTGDQLVLSNTEENALHVVVSAEQVGSACIDGFYIWRGNANSTTSVTLSNGNIIRGDQGGGLYITNSTPLLKNLSFSYNGANAGAGIYNQRQQNVALDLVNVVIRSNVADDWGGGIFNDGAESRLVHCSIGDNWAGSMGGGIYSLGTLTTLINTTVAKNTADAGAGIYNANSNAAINNSILWGNTGRNTGKQDNLITDQGKAATFRHSLVGGASEWNADWGIDGGGNRATTVDPFVGFNAGRYELSAGSAAINGGDNSLYDFAQFGDQDVARNRRLIGCSIDMGPFEFQGHDACVEVGPGNIIYVKKGGTGTGTSWGNPLGELGDALRWANDHQEKWAINGVELQIWVAKGTYKPMYTPEDGEGYGKDLGRQNYFSLVKNVQVYGGFSGSEWALNGRDWKNNETILSGDLLDNDQVTGTGKSLEIKGTADNTYHVVLSGGDVGSAGIDGFTIQGGNAIGAARAIKVNGASFHEQEGGGLFVVSSSPRIANIRFWGNSSATIGGAILNDSASPTIDNIIVRQNLAGWFGAGIFNGGFSSPTIKNAVITGNLAGSGAGVNSSFYEEGVPAPSSALVNVLIHGNHALYTGGGVHTNGTALRLTNVTIVGNSARDAGGISMGKSGTSTINNSIIYGNTREQGSSNPNVQADQYKAVFNNTLVGGATAWDTGWGIDDGNNKSSTTDPFTDSDAMDYTLKVGSEAIDAGDNDLYDFDEYGDYELAANERRSGCDIDMGAYELQGQPACVTVGSGNILYVKKGAWGDGSSWDQAMGELAFALRWANDNKEKWKVGGDVLQIWVAKGTYHPRYSPIDGKGYGKSAGRDNAFMLVKDVQIYGGFDPDNNKTDLASRILPAANRSPLESTILSGDLNRDDQPDFENNKDNAYHVVVSAGDVGSAVLDGFVVTGGHANGSSGFNYINKTDVGRGSGGGIIISSSSPTLRNLGVMKNAAGSGGGFFISASSFASLTNVSILENKAIVYAGGVYNHDGSSSTFTNVVISGNTSKSAAGIFNRSSSPIFVNVIIYGNIANETIGGILSVGSSPQFRNSIIWANKDDAGKPNMTYRNIYNNGSVTLFSNSILQGAFDGGTGMWNADYGKDEGQNKEGDPLFVDAQHHDYALQNCSPALNTGNHFIRYDKNSKAWLAHTDLASELDLAGNPRVFDLANGGIMDIGAYELQRDPIDWEAVVFRDGQVTYNGRPHSLVVHDLPAGITAMYEMTDSEENVTPRNEAINAGIYSVSVRLEGCGEPRTLGPVTLTIEKAPLFITANDQSKIYDGSVYSGSHAVIYSPFVNNEDEKALLGTLSYAGDAQGATDAGRYAIEPGGLSSDNYAITFVPGALTIDQNPHNVISFNSQVKGGSLIQTYGDGTIDASARASSGLVVAYESDNTAVATVDAKGEVQIAGAGTAVITANQLGNSNYNPATSISLTIVVAKAPLSITALDDRKEYDAVAYSGGNKVIYDGFINQEDEHVLGGTLSYAGSAQGAKGVGSYRIEPEGLIADNYTITYHFGRLLITEAELTVIAHINQSKIYGDAEPLMGYLAKGFKGLDDETLLKGNLNRISGEDAGKYEINQGDLRTDGNYTINFIGTDFEIKPREITGITLEAGTFEYDGLTHAVFIKGTLPFGVTVRYLGNAQTEAGRHPVRTELDGGNNYEDKTLTSELVIAKALLSTITFGTASFEYDGSAKSLQISGTLPDGVSINYVGNARTEAGVYSVRAELDGGNNYENKTLTSELVIAKALLSTITFGTASFEYDGSAKSLEISGTLPIGVSINYVGNAQTEAGRHPVRAELDGGNNYENKTLTSELVIAKATLRLLTFEAETSVYDGAAKSIFIGGVLPEGVTVQYSGNGKAEAGLYTVIAELDGGNNYENRRLKAELVIARASLPVLTFDVLSFLYDGSVKSLHVGGALPVGVVVRYLGNDQTNAGVYSVKAEIDGGNNYESKTLTGELIIAKASLPFMAFEDVSYVYDGYAKSIQINGKLPKGVSVHYSNNSRIDAGNQEVTATIRGVNHVERVLTAELEITKAPAVITGDDLQRHYFDGKRKEVIARLNHRESDLSYHPQQFYTEAGVYTVRIEAVESKNYLAAIKSMRIVIQKQKADELVFENKTVVYDGQVHALEVKGLSKESLVTYTGNEQIKAGTYFVSARVTHPHFAERTLTASLTIQKAGQGIDFSPIGTVSRDAGHVPMKVKSNSGLVATLSSDDPLVATVEGSDLLIHRLGTVRITASQAGNENYHAADPVTIIVRVEDEKEGPVKVHQALSPNGDGINEFLFIEGIREYPENRLQVLTRNGMLVFDREGYDNVDVTFEGISNTRAFSGNLPDGTYFYILEYRDGTQWKNKKGWFVLKIRN